MMLATVIPHTPRCANSESERSRLEVQTHRRDTTGETLRSLGRQSLDYHRQAAFGELRSERLAHVLQLRRHRSEYICQRAI